MKILHVPYCFSPDAVGGTEVYVESLAHELQRLGDVVLIAAPAASNSAYVYRNIPVRRFAVDPGLRSLDSIYGGGDILAAVSFEKILEEEKPDLVHLHALTSAISPRLAASIRRRKIPIVFTYHTPTVSCPRGSLLRWGKTPCDGELSADHCTGCTLQGLGLPWWLAWVVALVPVRVGQMIDHSGWSGRVSTALRMRALIALREKSFQQWIGDVNHVVAVSAWVKALLIKNRVPAEKISVCRHGLAEVSTAKGDPKAAPHRPLRLVFVGRLEPLKGLDLILRVLKKNSSLALTLDVYGIEVEGYDRYLETLCAAVAQDSRARLLAPLPHQELLPRLSTYDLLIVPSQGFETGPLVVLEAFAAGVPVLGSRLNGITEWVDDERQGRLVEATSAHAWAEALQSLVRDPSPILRWRQNLPRPRSMQDVALEMRQLYTSLGAGAHA